MTEAHDDDAPRTFGEIRQALLASEADIRALQHAQSHLDARWKKSGRTDLMPGRHLAIALTEIESARLRVGEAARLIQQAEHMARQRGDQ
jgi:hypothetical protein